MAAKKKGPKSQQLAGYNVRNGKGTPIKTNRTNDFLGEQINKAKRKQALNNVKKTKSELAKITGVKPKSNRSKSQLRAIFAKKK